MKKDSIYNNNTNDGGGVNANGEQVIMLKMSEQTLCKEELLWDLNMIFATTQFQWSSSFNCHFPGFLSKNGHISNFPSSFNC